MELTRFQKIMLAVLAGMLVFFGILMAVFRTHPGVLFEESLLKITEQDGQIAYSGKAHGTPVTITVSWPTNFRAVVGFDIQDRFCDVCEVEYPLEPIRTEHGNQVSGIRVTKNGQVLFEGGYDRGDAFFGWYEANGEWTFWPSAQVHVSGGYSDPWQYYETDAGDIVRFAFGPETAAHGDPALFGMAVFLSVFAAVYVLFWRTLFRWRHWAARDPEPSEGYLYFEQIGWVVLAAVIAVVYIIALSEIT